MGFDEYQKKASKYDLSEATTDLKAVGFIEKVLGLVGEAGETCPYQRWLRVILRS